MPLGQIIYPQYCLGQLGLPPRVLLGAFWVHPRKANEQTSPANNPWCGA